MNRFKNIFKGQFGGLVYRPVIPEQTDQSYSDDDYF